MRKLALLVLGCLVVFSALLAQTISVTGKVTDSSGQTIPGATIKERGSKSGVSADNNGMFTIKIKPGTLVTVSAIGFMSQDVTASSNMTVTLQAATTVLNEVVVTALGIRRNKNQLPYAAQQVSGDEVSRTRGANAAAALSGKVSGLQVIQGNGIGGSTNVVIRGVKSLTGNNQALFVVDGVPIDNSNTNSANQRTGKGRI